MTRVPDKGGFAERAATGSERSPASPIIIEILGELLKFVVKSRLPIGRLQQQHYISESSRRHKTCCGRMVECGLELKGGKLPGFGIIPTW
jgi:hypothetical protein